MWYIMNSALILTLPLYIQVTRCSPDDCVLSDQTLTCGSSLPDILPSTVTAVFVRDYKKEAIPQQQFSHTSWKNITTLDIIATSWPYVISPRNFRFLENLNSLGIHGRNVEPRSLWLSGLANLTKLDMSSCDRLVPNKLFRLLLEDASTLSHLRNLNLKYLHSYSGYSLRIDETFVKVLDILPIENLSLSGTNLVYAVNSPYDFNSSVKQLDISNVSLLLATETNDRADLLHMVSNLESVNITNTPVNFLGGSIVVATQQNIYMYISSEYGCYNILSYFLKIKYIFANHIVHGNLTMDRNNTIDISSCGKLPLQVLHLRQNGMRKLNVTLIIPENSLVEVDLSSNSMNYISPNICRTCESLEVMILKNNELSKMELLPEFESLIKHYEKLARFDISMNKVSHVPSNMFKDNTQLREIDLSDNSLVSITFSLSNLNKLQLLKLQNNKLLSLDSVTIVAINTLLRNHTWENSSLSIELYNNPFVCSCESLEFLQWVVDDLAPRTEQRLTCSLDDRVVDIGHVAIEEAKYSCTTVLLTPSFWVMLTVYVVVVVAVTSLFVRFLLKVRRELILHRMKNDFILKYKQGELKEKHIIFLSENIDTTDDGDDTAFVQVFDHLEKELIHQVDGRVGDKVVVSDSIRGQIGVYRDEAADNFIAQSCVVVLLISVAKPDNRYFKTDLELAKTNNKPIRLLSRRVPDRPAIKQYLRNLTVDLELRNNVWQPQTGWGTFCEHILTMAAEKHYGMSEKRQNHFNQI